MKMLNVVARLPRCPVDDLVEQYIDHLVQEP